MYTALPIDSLAGGWEMVCYGCTMVVALLSYLFALR
jgi:hypothetical protein